MLSSGMPNFEIVYDARFADALAWGESEGDILRPMFVEFHVEPVDLNNHRKSEHKKYTLVKRKEPSVAINSLLISWIFILEN